MANYTNMVSLVSHARRKKLGTSQTSSTVHPWRIGCAFVPFAMVKKTHNKRFPSSFHLFDQGKLFPKKPFIILLFEQLTTKQK